MLWMTALIPFLSAISFRTLWFWGFPAQISGSVLLMKPGASSSEEELLQLLSSSSSSRSSSSTETGTGCWEHWEMWGNLMAFFVPVATLHILEGWRQTWCSGELLLESMVKDWEQKVLSAFPVGRRYSSGWVACRQVTMAHFRDWANAVI